MLNVTSLWKRSLEPPIIVNSPLAFIKSLVHKKVKHWCHWTELFLTWKNTILHHCQAIAMVISIPYSWNQDLPFGVKHSVLPLRTDKRKFPLLLRSKAAMKPQVARTAQYNKTNREKENKWVIFAKRWNCGRFKSTKSMRYRSDQLILSLHVFCNVKPHPLFELSARNDVGQLA